MNASTAQLEYYYNSLKDKVGQKTMDKKINPDTEHATTKRIA